MSTPLKFQFTGYKRPPSTTTKLITVGTTAPSSHVTNIAPFKLPANIFMQNQIPSCVAHTVTWLIMYHWWKQTGEIVKLSPRFIYALCKTIDNIPAAEGTTFQAALEIAQQYGVCEDSYFTNDTMLDVATYSNATLISSEAKANAQKYRIADYQFLSDLSVAGLQNAIYENGVIGIGTDVSDYWWSDGHGTNTWLANILLPLKPNDAANPLVSGHAVALYAYGMPWDADYPTNLWGMNWWSTAWGYAGRFCYGANYEPTVYEGFVISLAPTQPAPSAPAVVEAPVPLTVIEQVVEEVVKEIAAVV